MDVLSDVLRSVRLTGAIYFDVHARAPWVAESPAVSAICSRVMPEFEHVIAFHIMLDGWCWAQVADQTEEPLRLESGDAIIFAAGDPHFMGTEKGKRSNPDMQMYYRPNNRALPFTLNEFGGDGEKARFVCGYLGCDAYPYNPMLNALPRQMHVRRSSVGGTLTRDLISVALQETERPSAGGETFLSKLSELMFVQAIRQHIESLPEGARGILSGLRDRHVSAALALMHGRPSHDWTLDSLAQGVGLSRSVFAERFAQCMGVPAMQYLGNWRVQLAARALEKPGISIAQAAAEVGYESEAAFNRAFKRLVGVPPGAWRRSRATAAVAN
ncbi:MAG: helix-turn-helix domain-containing protein [Alphaproteobacteria bacterium]|nr:helix-turn-helix domain-containing protein [Alphaproteobacteria bacterium]